MKRTIFLCLLTMSFIVNSQSLTVTDSGSLTIEKAGAVTVNGDFTVPDTTGPNVTLNSDSDEFAVLIVDGLSVGDITYNRYVNMVGPNEWDYIGPPTKESWSMNTFLSENSTAISTVPNNVNNDVAIGEHNNADDSWHYFNVNSLTGERFNSGEGYQMATVSGATLAFKGTIATQNQTKSIVNNYGNGNGGVHWNVVSNPYPSYINGNNQANSTDNFLLQNSAVIDDSYLAIYGWRGDEFGFEIYNYISGPTYIAPGQAFFIAAESNVPADLEFTQEMRTRTGGDDFVLDGPSVNSVSTSNSSSEFKLNLYIEDAFNGEEFVSGTRFYFDGGLAKGLDPGYDAGAFDQSSALMSRLPENDLGVGLAINAMATDDYLNSTVPLEINRVAGTRFTIKIEDSSLPPGVDVLLEDTLLGTLTDIKQAPYFLVPNTDLSGSGRFYLKIGNTELGTNIIDQSLLSIYKAFNQDFITIEGLANAEQAQVRLYNLIGQEVLSKNIDLNQSKARVSTTGLTTGIYILKLQADATVITKKLIID